MCDLIGLDNGRGSVCFASASCDNTVGLWNLESGKRVGVLEGQPFSTAMYFGVLMFTFHVLQ